MSNIRNNSNYYCGIFNDNYGTCMKRQTYSSCVLSITIYGMESCAVTNHTKINYMHTKWLSLVTKTYYKCTCVRVSIVSVYKIYCTVPYTLVCAFSPIERPASARTPDT